MAQRRVYPRALLSWLVALGIVALEAAPVAQAKPTGKRECIASGPPGQLQRTGSLEHLPTVQLDDGHWAVHMDRPDRPQQIRLISERGQVRELAKPRPFRPLGWFGRGSAIYALGLAKSLQDGKPNLVAVRWLPGRRSRVITLWQVQAPDVEAHAVLAGDTLAVVWSTGVSGKRAYHAGTADLERTRVSEAHALQVPADVGTTHLTAHADGFALIWTQGNALLSASIDRSGAPGKPARFEWKGAGSLVAAAHCDGTFYAIGADDDGLRLVKMDGKAAKSLVRFERFLAPQETQLTCSGDAAVVGRRVWNERTGNIAFWLTTVDADGNRSDRRVKDMKGEPSEIQMPRLSGAGKALTAFWTQGKGPRTELYARPIGCR